MKWNLPFRTKHRRYLSWLLQESVTQSFQSHCGPRVDSASNRNEYQGYSLGGGGKGGRCFGLTTLPPSCADFIKILGASTSWSTRGLSGPVQGQLYLYLLEYNRKVNTCWWLKLSTCNVPNRTKHGLYLGHAMFDYAARHHAMCTAFTVRFDRTGVRGGPAGQLPGVANLKGRQDLTGITGNMALVSSGFLTRKNV